MDYHVNSGQVSNGIILSYDSMYVYYSGTANSTTVNYDGRMYVSSGGVANSTTVNSYGYLYVSSGGTANSTTVNSLGNLYVSSGGTANSITVNRYGRMYVSSGGTATVAFNPWQGNIDSATGAVVTYLERDAGVYYGDAGYGLISKSKGDVFSGLAVNNGYSAFVYLGGTANATDVTNYGNLYVSSGGVANSTTVNSYGYMYVSSGGVANSTTVNSYGRMYVYSGGTAMAITENGGYVYVAAMASATFNANSFSGLVLHGNSATLHSGTTANSTTVNSYGFLYVSSGGTANSTTVNSRGYLYVSSGGVANSTTVNSAGSMYVFFGGVANRTTVNSSGYLRVSSGGVANETTVNPYGNMYVYNGGTANSTTVNDYGWMYVHSGGVANETTVNPYGNMYVYNGGTANSTTVNDYGWMYVHSDGVALEIKENGGYVKVADGASATFNANSFSGLVLHGNSATLHSGTTANSTTVNSRGSLYVSSGGVANSTTVNSSGDLYVSRGGVANSITVNSGGYLRVSSGGTADIVFNPWQGTIDVMQGASVTYLERDANIYCGDSKLLSKCDVLADFTVISGQSVLIYSVGVVTSTTVNGGYLYVSSGGVANETTVNSFGCMYVSDGGTANFTSVANGTMIVSNGGIASNVSVGRAGYLSINSGGKVTGKITIASNYSVSVNVGGIVDFDISDASPNNSVLISNLSLIHGIADYTITVSSSQSFGEYYLAYGSNNFNETISVKTDSGIFVGTLSPDQEFESEGKYYLLNKQNGTLSLIISRPPAAVLSVTADITAVTNGNVTITATFNSRTSTAQYSVDGSSWQNYDAPVLMTSNGTISFRGINEFGDISPIRTYTVSNIDNILPVKPITSADITAPTNQNVTITATFSNDSAQKQYSLDNSTWHSYTTGVVMSANGTVYFRGIDAAGNISDVTSYEVANIDKTPPVKPIASVDTTAPTNRDVTVTATFSNDSAQKQYSLDNRTWQTYTSGVVMSDNGTVYFRGIDAAGNVSDVASYAVSNIDKVASTKPIAMASTTAPTNSSVTVTATFSNDTATKQYSLDNRTWQTYTSGVVMSDNGTVYFRGIDAAGNVSDVASYAVSNIDRIPPEKPTAAASTTAPTNRNVTVTATFSNDTAMKQYSLDNRTWQTYTSGVVMSDNGTVYFRGIDAAGNVSDVASYAVSNIDRIPPEKPTAAASTTAPTNRNVTLTATYSSDTAQKQYSLDNSTWQTYTTGVVMSANGTVYFRGIDAVGNVSDVASYAVSNIDKVAPTKPTAAASTTAPTNRNVTVTATFSNDTAMKQYSLDNRTWQTYTTGVVMSANGTVYFRGIDAAGNISDITSYEVANIDRIPPEKPTAAASTTAPTNQNVTVTASFSNDTAQKQYSLDDRTWQTYTTGVVMSANGTVYFRGIDAAGNISDVASRAVLNIAHSRVGLFKGDMASAALVSTTDVMTGKSLDKTNNLMLVYNGGAANSTTVNNGGSMNISSGGTANNTTINKGGELIVSSGGVADYVVWQSGGKLTLGSSATLNSTTVGYGNSLAVSKGAVANSVTISSGGKVEVNSAGSANFVNIASSGALTIKSGGTATVVYVSRYAELDSENGATISGLHLLSRGSAAVGDAYLYDVHLYSSARLSCAGSTIINGGEINSNAVLYADSGVTASGITVNKIGTLYVSNGGVAYDTRLTSDGIFTIIGEASGIVASGGSIYLGDPAFSGYDGTGGWPTGNEYDEDIHASSTVLSSSWMHVYYGASATDTEVNSNSWLHVYYGGSVTRTEITSSGYLTVQDSGTADTVLLHSGGFVRLYTGAIVKGNVNVGGKVTVQKAGTSATEDVVRAYGANINFMLSERSTNDAAIITDLGMIMGATYFVTVSTKQASGTYKLATGATDFDATITVRTERGTELGTVSLDDTLSYGGCTYRLAKNSDQLSLAVSGRLVIDEDFSPADLNGDGRADVVMSITKKGHGAEGATGAWLIQENQTAAWGDLSQRNAGWSIFGKGLTTAGKTTADVYLKSDGNIVGAWTTDTTGKVTGWTTVGEFDSNTQVLGLGDFDGDGQTDLLLRNTNGAVGCHLTNGTGWHYFQSLGSEWKIAAVGDLNGDGRDDVVLKHDAGFAGSWLTQRDCTMAWADLDTLPSGYSIVGTGDFNGDGTDDVLLKNGNYYGAWLVRNGNAAGWFGIGDLGNVSVEEIADYDADGIDDLRIRTAAGDLGAQLVKGADTLQWKYYGSVGSEWSTSLAAI